MIRRDFLKGLGVAICAPYICRDSGLLMPIADRRLAAYTVSGHDQFGHPLQVTITIPAKVARKITRLPYRSYEYGELAEPIFQEAFRQSTLWDYSPIAIGPYSYPVIRRGDDFSGVSGVIRPSWLQV